MEHRSYMRRTRRSGLLLAYLVLSILFSSLVQAENTTKYDESIEHEIVILSEHNHHDEAFTQGLEMYNGSIYESTGLYGHSSLREVNPWTGDIIRSKSFNDSIFSEGITVYNNTIIMLTWETQTAYVFEMDNLSEISSYEYEGEGWGICFDGNSFVMSNGTSTVSFRNPETFEIERTVSVKDSFGNLINRINELEWSTLRPGQEYWPIFGNRIGFWYSIPLMARCWETMMPATSLLKMIMATTMSSMESLISQIQNFG